MKTLKIFFVLVALISAIGSFCMWGYGIYIHAPYEEKTYWMMLMFFMLWISDNSMKSEP